MVGMRKVLLGSSNCFGRICMPHTLLEARSMLRRVLFSISLVIVDCIGPPRRLLGEFSLTPHVANDSEAFCPQQVRRLIPQIVNLLDHGPDCSDWTQIF